MSVRWTAPLRIEYERYPRPVGSQPSLGTMVAVEGGPGYPTTGSRSYYVELLRLVMARRDLLLGDARGTGLSGALDYPAFRRTKLVRFRFTGACFRRDVPVTGSATWRLGTGAVRASRRVPGPRVRVAWNVRRQLARAALSGRIGGRRLRADILAP